MEIMTWHRLIVAPWIIFGVYWAIGALRTRRTVQKEPFFARYGIVFLEVTGFTLGRARNDFGHPATYRELQFLYHLDSSARFQTVERT